MAQVQDSSGCCINSKFSCAEKGYFDDKYLSLFTKKLQSRTPIINRGYYIRFRAIDELLKSWWSSVNSSNFKKFQIISLGAGYDSSYFRLKKNNKLPPDCHYVEVDFPEVLQKKLVCIKELLHSEADISFENQPFTDCAIVYHSAEYSMLGIDLRDIPVFQKKLNSIGLDPSAPTLFLSECSITYMEPKDSKELIVWIQENFPNSIFVTYEQVYPDDAFGIIMRNHFTHVGCPLKSITKYPDESSQIERFTQMGWSKCSGITMYNFYSSLPEVERERIQHLELFDEFEMWHEKCHHYVLIWAYQGLFIEASPQFLVTKKTPVQLPEYTLKVQESFNWKCLEANKVVQRFGHQVVPVSSSLLMLSGGFGMSDKKHQKLGGIVLCDVKSAKHLNFPEIVCPRMFHTATKLSDNSVVILGGRASPKKAYGDVLVIHFFNSLAVDDFSCTSLDDQSISVSLTTTQCSLPVSIWRHSASLVTVEETESIFIFGGCSVDHVVTNKCFLLNTETWQWTEIHAQECSPSARHSHSAAVHQRDMIIVSGGLSSNDTVLHSVHMFNCKLSIWDTLHVAGLLPRYSHTSHIWKNCLFLVGGVTSIAHHKLGVGVVNLTTLQAFEISLPTQDPEYPLLLCNHSSYLHEDEVFIIGGGGNCFSFGTHFNKKIVSFNLQSLTAKHRCVV